MSDVARKKTVNLLKEKGQVSEDVLDALLTVEADGLNEHLHLYVRCFPARTRARTICRESKHLSHSSVT